MTLSNVSGEFDLSKKILKLLALAILSLDEVSFMRGLAKLKKVVARCGRSVKRNFSKKINSINKGILFVY